MDRRQERNEEVARIIRESGRDLRDHREADCVADPKTGTCATCGRPMSQFETLIYRAL
jgi:hypothetical protein